MSKDQTMKESGKKIHQLLDEKQKNYHLGGAAAAQNEEGIQAKYDQQTNALNAQIDAELNKMSETVKTEQNSIAQVATEQATQKAKAQEQSNDTSANKAELENQQSRNQDLQGKIQEVNEQKALEEQNLASAKENTVNVINGLDQEERDFVVQRLTEQGNSGAVEVINSQPAPQQEAQDSNMIGQTQENSDQSQ